MSDKSLKHVVRTALRRWREASGLRARVISHQSPLRLVVVVALSTFVAEVLVMVALSRVPPLTAYQRALVDALLLVVLLSPALYFFLLRPLATQITRRQRTETELRRSEQRFRTVADFAHDWEYWISPDGQYVYNSPSCERITGYAPEDFEQEPRLLQEITHPEDYELVEAHFREERKDGETHSLDFRIVTRSGDVRWVNHVCEQVHDEEGRWLGWRGSNRDITARRKAEQEREQLLKHAEKNQQRIQGLVRALRQERDRLNTIMESTHANLAYLDNDFRFIRVNSAYAEQSGYDQKALIGKNHFDLFPDAENQAIFERVRDTGVPVAFHAKPFEFPDRPELGITYWDWTLVPVMGDDGVVEGLVLSLLNVTEREQLMLEAEDQRAKLQAIIENAPEGIVVADAAGQPILVNPAACEIFGEPIPCDQVFGDEPRLEFYRLDGTCVEPRDLPLVRSAMTGEVHGNVELTLVGLDGQRRDLRVDSAPIRVGEEKTAGAVGIFRDITERKRIEQAVRTYAERLGVLHELDQAILSSRSAKEIANRALPLLRELVDCQAAAVDLFDLDKGESRLLAVSADPRIQRGQPRAAHPDQALDRIPERASVAAELQALGLHSQVSFPLRIGGELIGALNLGMARAGELTSHQVDVASEVASQVAIGIRQAQLYEAVRRHAVELEELVEARTAELRASEERFRAIFEHAAIGITLADVNGQLQVANPAFQEIIGFSEDELQHMNYTEITHPDDLDTSVNEYIKLVNGEKGHYTTEKRYVRKDGDVIWARLTASLVESAGADHRYVVGMVEDITERKRAQAALIQAEKVNITGRLAASLAHEINNPLQAVIGCLGLANEALDVGDEDALDAYVSIAYDELVRAAGIVGQLRDLNRPTGMPAGVPTDVNLLIDNVLELTRKKLEDRRIRVIRRSAADLPKLKLDPDRIKQIFLNLVLNAIDAMPEGGDLTVSTRYEAASHTVMASFTDSGDGIPPNDVPRIFDPFFSTKADGTGLGLFVSQNIAREHGGSLEVESEEGKGCTFTVRLPA